MKAYNNSCSRCYGATLVDGFAARLSKPALVKYGTAQKLFNYIRQVMPQNNPGGLPAQEYYDIASYLLFQNGLLKPEQVVGAEMWCCSGPGPAPGDSSQHEDFPTLSRPHTISERS